MKIAITGTIGSGKTTVSILLRRRGMRVLDADQYTRICYYPESESYQRIVDLFGNEILDESGEADRRKIAAIVFNDAQKRQALDKIIHPEVEQGLEKFFAGHAGDPLVFAEIPLLFECGWQKKFDRTILVTCSQDTAIERLMKERDYTKEQAMERISTQMSVEEKEALADEVIHNDGTLKQLDHDTAVLLNRLKREAGHGA